MAKGRREVPPCSKTYGLPLYCATWVPLDRISSSPDAVATAEEALEKMEDEGNTPVTTEGDGAADVVANSALSPAHGNKLLLALGGGGGEGHSGVPNAILLTLFDFESRSLSDYPVHRVGTGGELPYRMTMHPGGDGFICSFLKSCRCFEWDIPNSMEPRKLAIKSSGYILQQLEDVGLQLALAFSSDGTALAAGGEDGHLRVFKWPSMDIILNQTDAHSTVKYVDFSADGKFLVSLGGSGPCRVWDLESSTSVTNLQVEEGEKFCFCRFSESSDILYVIAMHDDVGKVISWSSSSWKRISSKKIGHDPISAFSVSYDGKFLAIGTVEGGIAIVNSSDFKVQMSVKKAHLGPVTALEFSQDSRALVSTSFDSTARVTVIEDTKNNGSRLLLAFLVILLAILVVYFIK
ncbi:SEC12-like protein 2 [Dendrobium catenatum]|uniref:SEC12-like protein 2 n=1 Tax=Dendrobium catenatum TaxID=906689 RepID=A0A2I0XHX0_9ASPA|nr:SEC12-like protein 2 [Dendrobium catenatum]PKU87512.1 SEC12-like protein 2 [Dendrobium catenatum]